MKKQVTECHEWNTNGSEILNTRVKYYSVHVSKCNKNMSRSWLDIYQFHHTSELRGKGNNHVGEKER